MASADIVSTSSGELLCTFLLLYDGGELEIGFFSSEGEQPVYGEIVKKEFDGVAVTYVEFWPYQNIQDSIRPGGFTILWDGPANQAMIYTNCVDVSTLSYVQGGLVQSIESNTVYLVNVGDALTMTFDDMPQWRSHVFVLDGGENGGERAGSDWGLGDIVSVLINAAKTLFFLSIEALLLILEVYPLIFALISLKYWVSHDFDGWLEFIYMHVNAARTLVRFILDIIDQILPT